MSSLFNKEERTALQNQVDKIGHSTHYKKEGGSPVLCDRLIIKDGTLFVYPFGAVHGFFCDGCKKTLDMTFEGVFFSKGRYVK